MNAGEDLLGAMAHSSRERAGRALGARNLADWRRMARARPGPPSFRLSPLGFDLLCEIKFASPAAGALRTASPAAAAERARTYERAGATAISVLTEPERFGGDMSHLEAAAEAVDVPVMRKDFLVDPVQIFEARAAGAGGVLIIVRMLADQELDALLAATREVGLFALLEAFDGNDLERASAALEREKEAAPPRLVGVNSRNLVTLEVELERLFDLAGKLPSGVPAVAESGLEGPDDARALARQGYSLALVGTILMRADDPLAEAQALLEAGRLGRKEAACL